MSKQINQLAVGDTVYMFGGGPGRGATGGSEATISRVGRAYVYAKTEREREYQFDRTSGIEKVDSNYKRRLVIDRAAYLDELRCNSLHLNLRRDLPFSPNPGVTLADVIEAARLLRVKLPGIE